MRVSASGFSGSRSDLNGDYALDVSLLDLIRALATVGRPGRPGASVPWLSAFQDGGLLRLAETGHLGLMAISYTQQGYQGIRMRDRFWQLDGSEKQGVAYRLGMAGAKLFAEQKLAVPGLEHADSLLREGVLALAQGGKRGDLVGWDVEGDWHVFEAKGRSSVSGIDAVLTESKGQAANIRLVDHESGKKLSPATACGSVMDLSRDPLAIHVRDPDGEPGEETVYRVRGEAAISAHYNLIRALMESEDELRAESLAEEGEEDVVVRVGSIRLAEIELGIHETVYNAILDPATNWSEFGPRFANGWEPRWREIAARPGRTLAQEGPWSIGLDGYFVRLSRNRVWPV